MAQTPRPARVETEAVRTLERRYADAAQAATASDAVVTEASAKHLAVLLRAQPDARFAALEEASSILTLPDRGKLLASLKGQAATARPISAGTASRWAIFRSRLPYRIVPITIKALSAVAVVGLGLLAWHRTPEQWVSIRASIASNTQWRLPEGTVMTGAPTTDARFALLRRDSRIGVVRAWLPGRGYAEARVAIDDLQQAR
ncbi:hypothetical protein BV511_15065 [Methylorubrum extorquens]|uniref:hypothetical protein n=1 Tax=Methylorubrum extorquens TaxID=408 RepID=UPI0009727585|nr:hypothetical protein [Methylorubrum extorquens]APX85908.1 hypothetical protein BV511_15065 [Methylorubrum extorquens]